MTILMIVLCGVNMAIYIFRAGSAFEAGENASVYFGAVCGWLVALLAYSTLYIRERRG